MIAAFLFVACSNRNFNRICPGDSRRAILFVAFGDWNPNVFIDSKPAPNVLGDIVSEILPQISGKEKADLSGGFRVFFIFEITARHAGRGKL
jgi:hypothetical protein